MTDHPPRCWEQTGHETCALTAAVLLLEERAARATIIARNLRAATARAHVTGTTVPPEVLDLARQELHQVHPARRTWKRRPSTIRHGERNPRAKLTDTQVAALRADWAAREPQAPGRPGPVGRLATKYGISTGHLYRIVNGQARNHVPGTKFSDADVTAIRQAWADRGPQRAGVKGASSELSEKYGISITHLHRIVRGVSRVTA